MQSKHLIPLALAYEKLKLNSESEMLIRISLTKLTWCDSTNNKMSKIKLLE